MTEQLFDNIVAGDISAAEAKTLVDVLKEARSTLEAKARYDQMLKLGDTVLEQRAAAGSRTTSKPGTGSPFNILPGRTG